MTHSSPESGVPYEDPEFVKYASSETDDLPPLEKVIAALKTGHKYLGPDAVDLAAAAWLERLSRHAQRAGIWEFAKAILHGDDEHRGWLLQAASAFEVGEPLPAVRGSGPAQRPPDAREATLKMVAGLFEESVHETYTREEVVSIVEDMMRLGSPLTSTVHTPTENKEGGAS